MELLSEDLKHWNNCYLLRILFSGRDAGIIQGIQDGVSNATKFFEVRLRIVQLDGDVSNVVIMKTRCHVETQAYLRVINDRVEEIHATVKVSVKYCT